MPDISKLPELAQLFGTTIDHLLGCKSQVIAAAAEGTLEELAVSTPIDPQELVQAAPLLTPKQINSVSDGMDMLSIDRTTLPGLLPFINTDRVDTLLRRAAAQGMDICEFLPFASKDAIDRLARRKAEKGEDICCLLPFMDTDSVDALLRRAAEQGADICKFLPFASSKLLDRLADQAFPDE